MIFIVFANILVDIIIVCSACVQSAIAAHAGHSSLPVRPSLLQCCFPPPVS